MAVIYDIHFEAGAGGQRDPSVMACSNPDAPVKMKVYKRFRMPRLQASL